MIKTYQATEKTLTARPRSKRLRESGISSGTSQGASVVSASMETLWSRISETLEDGSISEHIETQLPAQVAKSLTLVDEATGKKITLSIVNGHVYVDGAIIAQSDVVAYGAEGTQVTTVEDLIAQQIQINPTETATATATKLKVNGVVYTIQGSGGGGGSFNWGGTSGSGNAITSMNYDTQTDTLSAVKGTTFIPLYIISKDSSGTTTIDFDNYVNVGEYAPDSDLNGWGTVNWLHAPTAVCPNGGFALKVYREGNYKRQVLFIYATKAEYQRYTYYSGGSHVWTVWQSVVYTEDLASSAVATARALSSARTLWGQSFDGSGNVSGSMTGVGNITPTDGSNLGSASAKFRAFLSQLELYGATPYLDFHFGNSTADYTSRIIETASGVLNILANVGIGVANPSKKLDVNGGIRTRGASQMDGIDLNNQTITRAKSIALVSPDGTKTRTLAVDNNGNLTVDGNIYATGSLTTLA